MKKSQKRKLQKKYEKEKKRKKDKEAKILASAKTQNGRHIAQALVDTKTRGDYRDYVLIFEDQLIDWNKTMTLKAEDDKAVKVPKPVLVHKSKLKKIVGEAAAAAFWHPTFGRLVDLPPKTLSKKKASEKNEAE